MVLGGQEEVLEQRGKLGVLVFQDKLVGREKVDNQDRGVSRVPLAPKEKPV